MISWAEVVPWFNWPTLRADELPATMDRVERQLTRRFDLVSPGPPTDAATERTVAAMRRAGVPQHPDLLTWFAWTARYVEANGVTVPLAVDLQGLGVDAAATWMRERDEDREWDDDTMYGTPPECVPIARGNYPRVIDVRDGKVGEHAWEYTYDDWTRYDNAATWLYRSAWWLELGLNWPRDSPGVHVSDPDLNPRLPRDHPGYWSDYPTWHPAPVPAGSLRQQLTAFEAAVHARDLPAAHRMRPGVPNDETARRLTAAGLGTHPDLLTWFAWHDGNAAGLDGPGHYTYQEYHLTLDQALTTWADLDEDARAPRDGPALTGPPHSHVPLLLSSLSDTTAPVEHALSFQLDTTTGHAVLHNPHHPADQWHTWPNLATLVAAFTDTLRSDRGWPAPRGH